MWDLRSVEEKKKKERSSGLNNGDATVQVVWKRTHVRDAMSRN